jgi:hypothetical protein
MLLKDAKDVRVGTTVAKGVYVGSTKVWPTAPSGFDPSTLSGLAIWLDAADLAGGAWPNKAAGGAATTIVGSPAPAMSANQLNDLPVVRFSFAQGRLRIQSGTNVNQNWTLVYVGRMVGPYAGRIVAGIYTPYNILVGFWNGQQDVMYDNGFTTPDRQTAWGLDWKMYSGDGEPGLSRLFSDGALLGSTTTAAGWGGTFAISGYDAYATQESCDCEVAEVVMFNRKLSDAERQQVEKYLHDKWFVEHTPPWSPADLGGSVLALEAADVPAGAVTTWPDRSTFANDVFVESGAPTSSGSFVTCTTTNALRTTQPLTMTGAAGRHFITLVRSRNVGGAFMGYGAPGEGALFDLWNYTGQGTLIWHGYGGPYDTVGGAPTFPPDVWHIVECFYDGVTLGVRSDGLGPDRNLTLATASAPWVFGHGGYSAAGDFDIAAFYAYDHRLTEPERQQVITYLQEKGLS